MTDAWLGKLDQYLDAKLAEQTGRPNGATVAAELGPRPNTATMRAPILALCEVEPADYLFDQAFSTTMRWLVIGDTGVGKTLIWVDGCHALANGTGFLNWKGTRPAKVAYFDGELPFETVRKRIHTSADVFGPAPTLTIYTRDILAKDGIEMPPFDTEEGQAWLWRELEAERYDCACFDSIGTLTKSIMVDEEGWRPMTALVNRISSLRTGQIWLHHTGHNPGHGYGTKTREWNMDAVIMLAKTEPTDPDSTVELRFTKARHRTRETNHLYLPITMKRDPIGWQTEAGTEIKNQGVTPRHRKRTWFLAALDELANTTPTSPGLAGEPVHKVPLASIRELMRTRGQFDLNDAGHIDQTERKAFQRAKNDLMGANTIRADSTHVWRIK